MNMSYGHRACQIGCIFTVNVNLVLLRGSNGEIQGHSTKILAKKINRIECHILTGSYPESL